MNALTLRWRKTAPPLAIVWHNSIKVEPLVVEQGKEPARSPTIIAVAPAAIGGAYYQHLQNSAQPTWIIPHNLGRKPTVTLIDSDGNVIEGNVKHLDLNVVQVDFSVAIAGSASLQA